MVLWIPANLDRIFSSRGDANESVCTKLCTHSWLKGKVVPTGWRQLGKNIHLRAASQRLGMFWAGQEPPLDAHHPWMPETPDLRNPSANKLLSRGIPRLRAPWAEPRRMVSLSSGISRFRDSRLRNLSAEEFLGSGVPSKGGSWPSWVFFQLHRSQQKIEFFQSLGP